MGDGVVGSRADAYGVAGDCGAGQGGQLARDVFEAAVGRAQAGGGRVEDVRGEGAESPQGVCAPGNEPFGSGGRRFDAEVGHVVEQGYVAFVADADDDREGKEGDVGRQGIVVERREVGRGAAAADYDHAVELLVGFRDAREGVDDGGSGVPALEGGGKEAGGEAQAVGVGVELVDEVAVARRALRRYDGYARRNRGPRQLAVQFKDAFGPEPCYHLAAPAQQVAEGVFGVDGRDVEREAVDGVERG